MSDTTKTVPYFDVNDLDGLVLHSADKNFFVINAITGGFMQ